MKGRIKYIVFSSIFALSSINTMAVSLGYTLYVNGEYLKCETPAPYEIDGVTLVPLRMVAEGLGCEVEWENPNVIIRKDGKEIILTIDKNTAFVNGTTISLLEAPILDYARYTVIYDRDGCHGCENPPGEKNIVMVPIRFICQALGATVDYKEGKGKVNITLAQVEQLTLDKVEKLSQKREDLSWEDFKKFRGEDIGSGLYVIRYPIDDEYQLCIGGTTKKDKPMYIYLMNRMTNRKIDIRYESVEVFLNNHESY